MKLQKQVSRVYQGKKYAKYVVVLNSELVEELDWKEGQELKSKIKDGKLIVEKE